MLTKCGSLVVAAQRRASGPSLGGGGGDRRRKRREKHQTDLESARESRPAPRVPVCPGVPRVGEQKWLCARFLGRWALGPQKSSQVTQIQFPGDREGMEIRKDLGSSTSLLTASRWQSHGPQQRPALGLCSTKPEPNHVFPFCLLFCPGGEGQTAQDPSPRHHK